MIAVLLCLLLPGAGMSAPPGARRAATPSTRPQPLGGLFPTVATVLGVAIQNDANTNGQADRGDTLRYQLLIGVSTSTANAVGFGITLDANTTLVPGSVQTSPIARADSYSAIGNVALLVAAPGVLANDSDADGTGPALVASTISPNSAQGGGVAIAADGSFQYEPPLGFEGIDSFSYMISDGEGNTDTATVTITVAGMIWFVDNTAQVDGTGRLSAPFNSLASLAAVNDGAAGHPAAGDAIFLYRKNATPYAGPLALLDSQKLLGQGATASLATILGITVPAGSAALPATGGTRPVIAASGATCLTLAQGNLVRGLDLQCTSGTALAGANFTSFAAADASVSATGATAVSLTHSSGSGSLNVTLTSVSASGGVNGLVLQNTTGTFTVTGDGGGTANGSGGTISSTSGPLVSLTGAAGVSLARMNLTTSSASGVSAAGSTTLTLDKCAISSVNQGVAVNASGSDVAVATIQNGTFSSNTVHTAFQQAGGASLKFKVLNCTMNSASANAIYADLGSTSTASGRLYGDIGGNAIGTLGVQHSGTRTFSAIELTGEGAGDANFRVQNNQVFEVINAADLSAISIGGTGTFELEAKSNTFHAPTGGTTLALCPVGTAGQCDGDTVHLEANARSLCADVASNDAYTPANGAAAYRLREVNGGNFTLEGTMGSAATQISSTNVGTPVNVDAGVSLVAPGSCASLPTFARAEPEESTLSDPPAPLAARAGPLLAPRTGSAAAPSFSTAPMVPAASPRGRARLQPLAGETLNIGFGDVPAGKVVTVTFDATVNSSYPPGTTQVCIQGLVGGSNFAPVLTDDPSTITAGDATCMPLGKIPGDVNDDGIVNVGDVFYLINYLFAGGPAPLAPANVNGDMDVNVGDVFYLIYYLFAGGPGPA